MSRYEPYFKSISKLGEVPWEKSSRKKLRSFKKRKWGYILENLKRKIVRKKRRFRRKPKFMRKRKSYRLKQRLKGRRLKIVKAALRGVSLLKRFMDRKVKVKNEG